MIKYYKKKPVVVSAVKWNGGNLQEINTFTDNKAMVKNNTLIIPTLEGTMAAEVDNCLLSDMSGDLNLATTEDLNNFKVHNGTENWDDIDFYIYANLVAQYCYQALRNKGWRPEQARQVLPLGLKTQAVYTAFVDDWKHFLRLRADNVSGKVHPNMQLVAKKIKDIIENL